MRLRSIFASVARVRERLVLVVCASLVAFPACVGDDPPAVAPTSDAGAVHTADAGGGNAVPDAGAVSAIEGDIIDAYARPVANATIRAGSAQTTTSATGHFQIPDVTPTYDLDVLAPSRANGKAITSFRGLTTRTPEVSVEGVYELRLASISGSSAARGTDQHLLFQSVDQTTGLAGDAIIVDPSATWSATATWKGATKSEASIWSLSYTTASGHGPNDAPTSFGAYQVFRKTLNTTTAAATVTSDLVPVGSATLSGSVVTLPAPAGSAIVSIALKNTNDRYGLPITSSLLPNGSFSITTATTLSANVIGQAGGNDGDFGDTHYVWKANQAANAQNVVLAFGTAARSVSPRNGAAAVTGSTTFTWTAGSPAGVYRLDVRCVNGTEEYVATVYTTTANAVPPDASALGAQWPVGGSCGWGVTLYQKAATVDAVVATATSFLELTSTNGPVDGAYAVSSGYTFTTP